MSRLSEESSTRLKALFEKFEMGVDRSLIPEMFALFDVDGSGRIEASELRLVKSQIFGQNISEETAKREIGEMDTNNDGTLDLEEFTNALTMDRD